MRVLFLLHQFFPEFAGGTEQVALGLAHMMQKAGHHVHVLSCLTDVEACPTQALPSSLMGAFDYVYEGVPVTVVVGSQLPPAGVYGFELAQDVLSDMERWMRVNHFNLVHVLHGMRMATPVHVARQLGLPLLVTLTDFFFPCARINLRNLDNEPCPGPEKGQRCARDCKVPPWDFGSFRVRYESAAEILGAAVERVVPSEYVAECYRRIFDDLHFRVIPHGLDLSNLIKHRDEAGFFPGESATLRLSFVGTLVPQKGLQVLLKALANLPNAPLSLSIAGSFAKDPGFEREIRRLVERDSRVRLLGQLDKSGIARLLAQTDLLCLPSIVPESYSLALREAAALSVPALVSDCGAQAEFVRASSAGKIVKQGSVEQWAEAIDSILADRSVLEHWRKILPLPVRLEEEAFFYESLYKRHAVV